MWPVPAAPAVNLLLAALPHGERQQFLAGCEPVELAFADILAEPGEPVRHAYFPGESVISVSLPVHGHAGVEVGLIGNEGMLGISLILGVEASPLYALVQDGGPALRMAAASFLLGLERSPELRRGLKRYLYVVLGQLAQTIACTRFHIVEARLARWLLMTRDRTHADAFHATHESLALRLGVRRAGITSAATALQNRHLIRYSRGHVTVLDRRGLEAASCPCYEADRRLYARIMDCT